MLWKKAIVGIAPILLSAMNADDPLASYQETIGNWRVAGDPKAGGCASWRLDNTGGTKLVLIAAPSEETVRFSISNAAWKSLGDEEMKLGATFQNASGNITDAWDLSAVSTSVASGGPRIHFDIWRAKNDGASFVDQFAAAAEIAFWRGTVPVARFDLKSSSKMIDSLMTCRSRLRMDEGFDPFARD